MEPLIRQRTARVFTTLLLITALSFWLTIGRGYSLAKESDGLVWAQVTLLAGVKVRLILLDFMELRHAPWRLRIVFELFVAVVVASLIAINAAL